MRTSELMQQLQDAAGRLSGVRPRPERLDDAARAIADDAVRGVVHIYYNGDHRLELGRKDIDWLNPAFPKETLGFLARMAFLDALAAAYLATRDETDAEAARDYLVEYMAFWPLEGIGQQTDYDNTMEIGIRCTIWAQNLHRFLGSPAFDDAFLARVVAYIEAQMTYMASHVSTTINWRVNNAHKLLLVGLYLPMLGDAAAWRRTGVRLLNDAWFRQFLPDGAHIERNPVYHGGMAGTFTDLYRLQQALPELGLAMTRDRLAAMHDFALACVKPNGYLCGIHDSQSDFTGHLRDGKYTEGHKGVDHTAAWERFRRECGLPLDRPATSQIFPDAGLAFLRTGWDDDAAWMSFDATRWGGGHCHLSRNTVQLHAFRQSMVVDPGWLDYTSNAWGKYGRSTRAHSTCNLNGRSQQATDPTRFETCHAPGYDAVFSIYEGGYWDTELAWTFTHAGDGRWAQHARLLCWVQDRFAFVADSMFRLPRVPGDPEDDRPSFECVWQLAPEADIRLAPARDRATAQWTGAGLLLLVPIRPAGAQFEVHAGETDPLRGWTPGEHAHHPAPQVVLHTPRMDRQHDYYVTVLVPYRGREAPAVAVEATSPMGTLGDVKLRWADGTADEIHWGCNFGLMLGVRDGFETDSSLVHLRRDAGGAITGGCCFNGTYLAPCDTTVRARPETFVF